MHVYTPYYPEPLIRFWWDLALRKYGLPFMECKGSFELQLYTGSWTELKSSRAVNKVRSTYQRSYELFLIGIEKKIVSLQIPIFLIEPRTTSVWIETKALI